MCSTLDQCIECWIQAEREFEQSAYQLASAMSGSLTALDAAWSEFHRCHDLASDALKAVVEAKRKLKASNR